MESIVLLQGGSLRISQADVARLEAGHMPEQMYFEGVFARPEVNRNRDGFTGVDLTEIAGTLAHTPIDDEHQQGVVKGSILSARYDPDLLDPKTGIKGALLASCVTWPRRFPDEALGLMRGTTLFSIESAAESVSCSTCQAVFATTDTEDDYCACLKARKLTQSTARYWHKHRGIGAAFTTNPAGSNCGTVAGSILLVASYDQEHSPARVAQMLTASVFAAATEKPQAQRQVEAHMHPDKFKALLATFIEAAKKGGPMPDASDDAADSEDDKTAKKAMCSVMAPAFTGLVAHFGAAVEAATRTASEALIATHTVALEAAKQEGAQLVLAERRLGSLARLPRAVPDPEVFRPLAASASDDQWNLTLGGYQKTEELMASVTTTAPTTPVVTPPPAAPANVLLASANTHPGAVAPTSATQAPVTPDVHATPKSLAEWGTLRYEYVAPQKAN